MAAGLQYIAVGDDDPVEVPCEDALQALASGAAVGTFNPPVVHGGFVGPKPVPHTETTEPGGAG